LRRQPEPRDILGILDYGVKWANTGVYPPNGDSKAPPDRFQDFTDYAKAVVEHFKGKAGAPKAYEIWNEPNAGSQGEPGEFLGAFDKAAVQNRQLSAAGKRNRDIRTFR